MSNIYTLENALTLNLFEICFIKDDPSIFLKQLHLAIAHARKLDANNKLGTVMLKQQAINMYKQGLEFIKTDIPFNSSRKRTFIINLRLLCSVCLHDETLINTPFLKYYNLEKGFKVICK
jgi:hypothetical protein